MGRCRTSRREAPRRPTPVHCRYDSPIGPLLLYADARTGALTGVHHPQRAPRPAGAEDRGPFADVIAQLEEHFAGERRAFTLPLAPEGTPWQQRVWAALRDVAYGTTTTYGALAARLGVPSAARAVGHANGANPLSIVVPCHRVVGASGHLTGYAGGLERKARLLAIEGCVTPVVQAVRR